MPGRRPPSHARAAAVARFRARRSAAALPRPRPRPWRRGYATHPVGEGKRRRIRPRVQLPESTRGEAHDTRMRGAMRLTPRLDREIGGVAAHARYVAPMYGRDLAHVHDDGFGDF